MRDFWLSCGHHLTDRDAGGGLLVTNEFVKSYLARPELIPPLEACAAERALHAMLLADSRRRIAREEIAALFDADARENWQLLIAFRDHLTQQAIDVEIEPVTEMRDVSFNWYLGLDAVGTQIGDTLWNGSSLDQRGQASVVGLYQLKFEDPTVVAKNIRSEPVYLILAMTPDKALHMKPQNLLTGLPIRHPEPVN